MLIMRLESAGYKTISADNGLSGLNLARKEKPDMVILDIMLPGLDGHKVCRMLKFDKKYKMIPIIMLTARVQESDQKLGLEVGADAYLTKPFVHKKLLAKMKELLGQE